MVHPNHRDKPLRHRKWMAHFAANSLVRIRPLSSSFSISVLLFTKEKLEGEPFHWSSGLILHIAIMRLNAYWISYQGFIEWNGSKAMLSRFTILCQKSAKKSLSIEIIVKLNYAVRASKLSIAVESSKYQRNYSLAVQRNFPHIPIEKCEHTHTHTPNVIFIHSFVERNRSICFDCCCCRRITNSLFTWYKYNLYSK